jgi:glycosyltransferase involved in cell wall biosynthesis
MSMLVAYMTNVDEFLLPGSGVVAIKYLTPRVGTKAIVTFKDVGSSTWTPPTGVTSVDYLVVGGGIDKRVETLMNQHPELKQNVVFTGSIPNERRVDYYNLPDLYILPSKFEGFGIVFIESLACGVPVIASDGYGCRAGLLNEELGIVVPPDDITAIAKAIVSILKRSAPSQLFDREILRQKTLDVYGIDKWNDRVRNLIEILSSVKSIKLSKI